MHKHCGKHYLETEKSCHEHHHTHTQEKEIAGVQVSHHEEASIYSISKNYKLPYKELLTILTQKLEDLSAWIEENDGFVGHIKGYITDESHAAMVSVTGGYCSVTENPNTLVKFSLTCIVFGVDEEKMCQKIIQILQLPTT